MTLRLDRAIAAAALIAVCSPASNPVLAQQPTQQQIDAIRSNCRSDFLSNCSGVPRGGPEAVRCLKDHLAQLSPGCNAAVSAITPAPAPKVAAPTPAPAAPTPPTPPPAAAPAAATPVAPPAPAAAPATPPAAQPSTATAPTAPPPPATTKKVPPAPPKSAQPAAPQPAAPQPNRAAAATTPAAPPAPAPAAQPTSLLPLPPLRPRVRLMIVRTCGAEHRALCASVPAGGGIVECLAEHGDALSPRCRDAILSAK
jgi:hypothetical protein